jgi:26S proteasome regulatory subunit N2
VVPALWFEVSAGVAQVEALYEDESFPERLQAALLASKVYYYLGELKEALSYALCSGELFDVADKGDYVQTLLGQCLDEYIRLRQAAAEDPKAGAEAVDPRLEAIVERLFQRCVADGQTEQAVGVALDARRLDKVVEAVAAAADPARALKRALETTQTLVSSSAYRQEVLAVLVKQMEAAAEPDWVCICQCLVSLGEPARLAEILKALLAGSEHDALLAYQVAFDLFGNPGFTFQVANLRRILDGSLPIKLHLDFLHSNNRADAQILKNIKSAIESRNSVCHGATICANALMHAGTTADTFLRENLDWLSRATNWAKFSATAGLGVIHRGHLSQGKALMAPYLPSASGAGGSSSPYPEGGALFALGLIHADRGSAIKDFLLQSLRNAGGSEVIQHGACLGLGLASLGSAEPEVFDELKSVLYTDSAVAGEAAGIALGLLGIGADLDRTAEMLAYAHDTQHEKIIRGLALGCALIALGKEEGADALIEQMVHDQDPIVRYGGMHAVGLAYRGTANNGAIQKLLLHAVSDVSDDVRRAAVMCLGYVMYDQPEQCPKLVTLLAESYNPQVRYGSAMAVGIACAGTGLPEAKDLLDGLLTDAVDYVRQGAYLAMAMVMQQQPEAKVGAFRKQVDQVIADKHEGSMGKMGAILAAGILDAGGRNVAINLRSRAGFHRDLSLVGLALFTQYWYWYPLTYFLSLSFVPTALIGLNGDLDLPQFSVTSHASPSTFAYAKPAAQGTSINVTKLPTAVLSVTLKEKARKEKKEQEEKKLGQEGGAEAMETSGGDAGGGGGEPRGAAGAEGEGGEAKKAEPKEEEKENPCRVVPAQEHLIKFPAGSRYVPVKPGCVSGVLVLRDTQPDEPVALVTSTAPTEVEAAEEEAEPAPPEPFDYTPAA